MIDGVFFFMYVFAGFAGMLAILLAGLLIKYWSSGNKALLGAIRNFMICTALIDALYFWFEYDILVNRDYGSGVLLRVADICLFIGQVYFWAAYMREKTMAKDGLRNNVEKLSLAFLCGAPGGARFLRVQVPNPPGSGKDIAEGKGVHREVESEGSRMWGTY